MLDSISVNGEDLLDFLLRCLILIAVIGFFEPTAAIAVSILAFIGTTASLLILAVINSSQSSTESESPEEILKRRYAEGEINEEEFDRRLNDIIDADENTTTERELELERE